MMDRMLTGEVPMKTTSDQGRHQRLADLATVVNAPGIVLSQVTGDIGVTNIEGFYLDDRRILSEATLRVNGRAVEHLVHAHEDPMSVQFTSLVAHVVTSDADFGLDGDAQIEVTRRRRLESHGLLEHIDIRSLTTESVELNVELVLAADGSDVSMARTGISAELQTPKRRGDADVEWVLPETFVRANLAPSPTTMAISEVGRLSASWAVVLESRGTARISVTVSVDGELDDASDSPSSDVCIEGSDGLVRLFERSMADARALIRTDGKGSTNRYMTAGSPWYLTLFGRDSLWSARMMLAFDPDLAVGTLRALALRQGVRDEPATAEQPGKILHEARRQAVAQLLPATYYGTADATALWIVLLVEAWRWGMSSADAESFLPALRSALSWIERQSEEGGGFIQYHPDPSGLSNQGWKDSRDAIHDHDGRHYPGPVALVEVQGYAYLAVSGAADFLEELGEPDADRWRAWAAGLRRRFGERFWTERDGVRYPATALIDGRHLADSATSNMGHLLGTGILSGAESALVAARLGATDLTSDFGLRTLSTASPRYNPLSYHNGSIWPHDTAITVRGLTEEGHTALAQHLAHGVLAAAEVLDFRLPELWSGEPTVGSRRGSRRQPTPYPTACSPQAWSSASIASLVVAALGLRVDVPGGEVSFRPVRPLVLGAFTIRGIRVGNGILDVRLNEDASVEVLTAPSDISIKFN